MLDFVLAGKLAVMPPTTGATAVDMVAVAPFGPGGGGIFTFFSFGAFAGCKELSSLDFRFLGMLMGTYKS